MNSFDLILMGIKNLWRRKLRTFLTILGVVIGTSSILIMISFGLGMTESFKAEIGRMGNLNVIEVYPGYNDYYMMDSPGGKRAGQPSANQEMNDETVAAIARIKGVEAVTPILESYFKIVSGKYASYVSVRGIIPETMKAFDYEATQGRLLEDGDKLELVFGGYIPRTFYNTRTAGRGGYWGYSDEILVDVMEDRLVMTSDMSYGDKRPPGQPQDNKAPKLYRINGVGILKEGNYNHDYFAYMNIYELKRIMEEAQKSQRNPGGSQPQQGYHRMMVKAKDFKDVPGIQQQIKEMGYQTSSLNDIIESMKNQSAQLQAILGGIGAVSLLVAALGITNTMIMSIYERTKEIGVMKVIGAALSDIRRLFLLEAGLIGFFGGAFGLGLSFSISYLLNSSGMQLFGPGGPGGPGAKISIIPLWLVAFALIFTTLVGLISGFYPARRAMKLSPLEAIRTE